MVPLLPVTVNFCIPEWGEGREERAEAAQVSFQGHVPDPLCSIPYPISVSVMATTRVRGWKTRLQAAVWLSSRHVWAMSGCSLCLTLGKWCLGCRRMTGAVVTILGLWAGVQKVLEGTHQLRQTQTTVTSPS